MAGYNGSWGWFPQNQDRTVPQQMNQHPHGYYAQDHYNSAHQGYNDQMPRMPEQQCRNQYPQGAWTAQPFGLPYQPIPPPCYHNGYPNVSNQAQFCQPAMAAPSYQQPMPNYTWNNGTTASGSYGIPHWSFAMPTKPIPAQPMNRYSIWGAPQAVHLEYYQPPPSELDGANHAANPHRWNTWDIGELTPPSNVKDPVNAFGGSIFQHPSQNFLGGGFEQAPTHHPSQVCMPMHHNNGFGSDIRQAPNNHQSQVSMPIHHNNGFIHGFKGNIQQPSTNQVSQGSMPMGVNNSFGNIVRQTPTIHPSQVSMPMHGNHGFRENIQHASTNQVSQGSMPMRVNNGFGHVIGQTPTIHPSQVSMPMHGNHGFRENIQHASTNQVSQGSMPMRVNNGFGHVIGQTPTIHPSQVSMPMHGNRGFRENIQHVSTNQVSQGSMPMRVNNGYGDVIQPTATIHPSQVSMPIHGNNGFGNNSVGSNVPPNAKVVVTTVPMQTPRNIWHDSRVLSGGPHDANLTRTSQPTPHMAAYGHVVQGPETVKPADFSTMMMEPNSAALNGEPPQGTSTSGIGSTPSQPEIWINEVMPSPVDDDTILIGTCGRAIGLLDKENRFTPNVLTSDIWPLGMAKKPIITKARQIRLSINPTFATNLKPDTTPPPIGKPCLWSYPDRFPYPEESSSQASLNESSVTVPPTPHSTPTEGPEQKSEQVTLPNIETPRTYAQAATKKSTIPCEINNSNEKSFDGLISEFSEMSINNNIPPCRETLSINFGDFLPFTSSEITATLLGTRTETVTGKDKRVTDEDKKKITKVVMPAVAIITNAPYFTKMSIFFKMMKRCGLMYRVSKFLNRQNVYVFGVFFEKQECANRAAMLYSGRYVYGRKIDIDVMPGCTKDALDVKLRKLYRIKESISTYHRDL